MISAIRPNLSLLLGWRRSEYHLPYAICEFSGYLMGKPWENWIPGVLSKGQMQALVDEAVLFVPNDTIGAASLDLTLTAEAYKMKRGSVKPGGDKRFSALLKNKDLAEKLPASPEGFFVLGSKETYVFEVAERLDSAFAEIGIYGQATAKSSVGRMDVLARLIVDGMDKYENFDAPNLKGQSGQMYLEITPFTFPVAVQVGKPLSQLRLFYGRPKDVEISSPEIFRTVFRDSANCDGSLSVDLENTLIGGLETAAFRATVGASCAPIKLWESGSLPNPCESWKFVKTGKDRRLRIENDQFYILRSKEKIRVPAGVAIYCRASDETIGEMRIHYAGFVHPHFGIRDDGAKGTPLIFEVRGHQVDVNLRNGERMANLTLYRMSEDAEPDKTTYGKQTLKLSGFFGDWPQELREVGSDGTVEAV